MHMTPHKTSTQSGFTLIEMMIALTVGLIILGALTAVLISSANSAKSNDRVSELQTNGRYALSVIQRDVQHAGLSGLMPSATLSNAKTNGFFNVASGVAVTNDCAAGFSLKLEEPVFGIDNTDPTPNPYAGTCIPAANYLGGDILVVRYADMQALEIATTTAPPTFAYPNDIYLRSSYSASTLFQKGVAAQTTLFTGLMQDQLMKTYVYYINKYTSVVGDNIPALWRVALTSGAMTPELVASGIENLQVQYGVVNVGGNTQFLDANNITAATWPLVKSVRVWLLARNSTDQKSDAYTNTTDYSPASSPMGNLLTLQPNDKYRRQLYMSTIDMRN